MSKLVTAATSAALIIAAAGLSYAQTPPSTDRQKGTAAQTSAHPKMDKGGMKATTRKATKGKVAKSKKATKTRTARATKRAPAKQGQTQDNWWNWGWDDDKKGKKR